MSARLGLISSEPVRCAAWAREHEVQLGGTAPTCNGFLLVEWPHPWPRDVSMIGPLGEVHRACAASGIRLQLVRPEQHAGAGSRLCWYRRDPSEPFAEFHPIEVEVDPDDVPRAALELLGSGSSLGAREMDSQRDLLICGHGARDVCCGSTGTELSKQVRWSPILQDAGVRVWRTSHLGGHRFAPTAVTLPDGLVWGRLDVAAIDAIVARSGPVGAVIGRLRGCSGLRTARGQLLDRALLAQHGWAWLDRARLDAPLEPDRVTLSVVHDGETEEWEGLISEGRDLPVPACRAPIGAAEKTERELVLAAYRSLP